MLRVGDGSVVYLALHPVDFRRGIAALSSYAREHLGVLPDSGVVLVFRSRRPGRVKVLFHDGSGMVLVAKWPDRGSFRWPPVSEGILRLSRVEFSALFDVWTRPWRCAARETSRARRPTVASSPRKSHGPTPGAGRRSTRSASSDVRTSRSESSSPI